MIWHSDKASFSYTSRRQTMSAAYLFIFTIIMNLCFVHLEIPRPRGVSITKAPLYAHETSFRCFDGSLTMPFSHVNDDYCDCPDASDEPGTSACPNGSFHCTNSGYKPLNLPSSRVNDGICDCCDGTDEYSGIKSCENKCMEVGKKYREELEELKKVRVRGHELFKEYCAKGAEEIKNKKARLTDLEEQKQVLEERKETLEAAKLEAEEPEKAAKESHEKAWEEQKQRKQLEKEAERAEHAFKELDANKDNQISILEMKNRSELDIDSSGDVSDEEAKEYLEEQEFVDFQDFKSKIWPNLKDIIKLEGEKKDEAKKEETTDAPPPVQKEEFPDQTASELDEAVKDNVDDDDRDNDEDYEKHDDGDDQTRKGEEAEKTEEPEDAMPPYPEETQKLIDAAQSARDALNTAGNDLSNVEREIKEIQKLLGFDLGDGEAFYGVQGQCFEFTDREYTYQLCPFDKVTQRNKHGGSETSLGNWGHWDGPDGDKYKWMKFTSGQNCWNGPDRSARVRVSCGAENALRSASEPNRCEYEMHFTTPAACHKPPPAEEPKDAQRDEL